MEIVVSGTSGELADFTERMIGVRDVSSQKPYEAKPGYVPLSDWKDMIRAAPSATRDTTSAPPSGAGLSDANEPADEFREIYDDGCKYITLNPLPEAIQTEAEAVQYVGDHMWIPRPAFWKWQPGDIYSTRYKLCRRRGRWWVYLYYLVIQD